tara:strand:- start:2003 stop:2320 length:318 start_codon:yes stop_codon:yes gene_type:complete
MEEGTKTKKKIQSSIEALSVGDERRCFNQVRRAADYITEDTLLWNGWSAGSFALKYIIGHHSKRKKKAEEKNNSDGRKKRRNPKTFFSDTGDSIVISTAPDDVKS